MPSRIAFSWALALATCLSAAQADEAADRKTEYVRAVTRGAGMLPWQEPYPSEAEHAFRAEIEARKDALLAHSAGVARPALYTVEALYRARANAAAGGWAADWVAGQVELADYVLAQPDGWVARMIPEEAPAHGYGFTCLNCVGVKSQEAVGTPLVAWSYKDPDTIACRACGQCYPDPAFPETATLELPRTGHRVTYYLNEAERAHPDDRSGAHAWHWVGRPVHVSFTGIIREFKIGFMRDAARSLAFAYVFTGDARYARAARDILTRYARCYRNWPYRDYWDTYADCDPIYAAWHDMALPLEWKRHLSEQAYAKDTAERARMLQTYWGAGRAHPSTDSVSGLAAFALAYDLTCTAASTDGAPVWGGADRRLVERDLLLEYIMGAEPYVGGVDAADCANNKCPRIYSAMAAVAKCLGIPAMADTALRGYERVRDESFAYDGFCTESPAYNNMYLAQLLVIPETLHGFAWPDAGRPPVDCYATDPMLRRMYRAVVWTLQHDGAYVPLSDTRAGSRPSSTIAHLGLRRFPEYFAGRMSMLGASGMSEYALFHLTEAALKEEGAGAHELPETCFPAWRTAFLRGNPEGAHTAMLTLAFNPKGGHRHYDNLGLFYRDGGRTVLGDLGYVGDMPVNAWIKSTQSHNLVVVDGADQRFGERVPQFVMMAASPLASVVEATSDAYTQCSEYRRRVVLVKGAAGGSFVLDLFRVAGGDRHAYRVFSEFAASGAADASLEFTGGDMPPELPLPDVGASLAREDIFGLRDVRGAVPAGPWQAVWRDADGGLRLWMHADCDRAEASNGPGQRSLDEAGRRVRYVDAVREGENLESVFAAVHEPLGGPDAPRIASVDRLAVPAEAGPRAVALRIDCAWGVYLALHDFERPAEVAGARFQGEFALLRLRGGEPPAYLAVAAELLEVDGVGFRDDVTRVAGPARRIDAQRFEPETPSAAWPVIDPGARGWVAVQAPDGWTGFPLETTLHGGVGVKDYPLPEVSAYTLPSLRFHLPD